MNQAIACIYVYRKKGRKEKGKKETVLARGYINATKTLERWNDGSIRASRGTNVFRRILSFSPATRADGLGWSRISFRNED